MLVMTHQRRRRHYDPETRQPVPHRLAELPKDERSFPATRSSANQPHGIALAVPLKLPARESALTQFPTA